MKKIQTSRRETRQPLRRKSGSLAKIFFLLCGMILGGAGVYIYQNGYEESLKNWESLFREQELSTPPRAVTKGRVVEAIPMDLRPLHEQDSRWERAIAAGEAGVALFEKAVREHYGDHGDPFVLRARMTEAKEMLESALRDLQAMREQYSTSKSSVVEIDKKIRRYSGSLEEYGPKARLH